MLILVDEVSAFVNLVQTFYYYLILVITLVTHVCLRTTRVDSWYLKKKSGLLPESSKMGLVLRSKCQVPFTDYLTPTTREI